MTPPSTTNSAPVEYEDSSLAENDFGAFTKQQSSVFGAHAAGTTRDQRDFAGDSSH